MKLLKSIILMAALLVGAGAARAALDFPSVPTLSPGKNATLAVGASTGAGTTALQFTMTLPDGIALANTTVSLDKERATNHTYRLNKVSDTSYKCVIYSNSNTPFTGTSGKLFSITLKPASTATKGDYALNFTEIRSADATGKETMMPDASVTMPLIIPATSVTVEPSSADIHIGDEIKLTATVSPAEAGQAVVWSSSNEAKVTVSEDGTARGIAAGYAYVTATTTDGTGRSARCRVNVSKVDVTGITLSSTSLNLHLGETGKLTATVNPANATNKAVSWKSSNTSVVTVDSEGNLTPKAEGTATVTVTSADKSSVTASCQVRVLKALITSVALDQTTLSLRVRDTATLKATVVPAASAANTEWSSSNTAVATVSAAGVVTAVAPGNAVITLAATDGTGLKAECSVKVEPALVTSVTLDRSECSLYPGGSVTLNATVKPDYAANRTLAWTSSDETVATVDNTGQVVATGLGNAVITAAATDGSGKSAVCAISVVNAPSSGVVVEPTEVTLRPSETAVLKATVLPETAVQKVSWSSNAPAVATVDENGVVTALKAGDAIITATTTDGKAMRGRCRIKVLPPLATSIKMSTELTIYAHDSELLYAEVLPAEASQELEWKSSDSSIASVDESGLVFGFSAGTAVITATATDGSGVYAECTVYVLPVQVTGIAIDRSSLEMRLGDTEKLNVTIYPDDAGDRSVMWMSNDDRVATVDDNGVVTATGIGEAIIAAISTSDPSIVDRCIVIVLPPLATSVTLSRTDMPMFVGDTEQLTATVVPAEASQDVKWKSSAPDIARGDENGVVYGLSSGDAVITAIATDGSGVYAECAVDVRAVQVLTISIDRNSMEMRLGDTEKLNVIVYPEEAADLTVTWISDNEEVATVSEDGTVVATGIGETVITAVANGGYDVSDGCTVTVLPPLAKSIMLSRTEVSMFAHDVEPLTAVVSPHEASQEVEWKSSDPEIASVDEDGFVYGVSAGSAIITATATDGSGVYAECVVDVSPVRVNGITLDRSNLELRLGDSEKLNVTIYPEDAADRSVMWMSNSESIATVSDDGTVVATGVGETIIAAISNSDPTLVATCTVIVLPPLATSITLDSSMLEMETEQTATLQATILPAEALQTAEFSSSAPDVASVDENGTVTALSPGTAVIIASTVDGTALNAVCVVTVKEKAGINDVSAEGVSVAVRGNDIIVTGLGADVEIKVTDASGAVVYSGREHRISGLAPGFHIVIAGTQAYKVILK